MAEYPYILVTGSRHLERGVPVWAALSRHNPMHLWHGGADGADELAVRWCRHNAVPHTEHPYISALGARGGMERNRAMVAAAIEYVELHGRAARTSLLVLAFPQPDSKGTWGCARYAKRRGLRVIVHELDRAGELIHPPSEL